jgi:subtilisin
MKRMRGFGSIAVSVVGIVVTILFLCLPAHVTRVTAQEVPGEPAADLENGQALEDQTVEDLRREVQQRGSVKIIVKLGTAFRAEGELSSAQDVSSQRAAIAQGQDQLLAALAGHRISNVKRFKYVPYMALTVDDAGLGELINNPAVVHIFEDERLPLVLAQSVPLINAEDVWAAGFTGTGWAVAILDTGVDQTHSFLDQGKVVSEACYSTTESSQLIASLCPNGQTSQTGPGAGVNCPTNIDGCEHGTHVAGIAAGNAAGTTRPDLSGVAKDASIIAIQVFSQFNDVLDCFPDSTPCISAVSSDIGRGLERVFELRNTFQIAAVNMSLGGGKFTSPCDAQSPLTSFIQNLRSVNIASAIASGNNGFTDGISNPACISSAISVGNTTKSDVVNSNSNSASFLSLLAPGTSIVSAVPGNTNVASLTGTSMAAPHVAGAFALLRQAEPSASVGEILSALQSTGVPITDTRNNITKPRINVQAALNALRGCTGTWALVPGGGFTPSAPAATGLDDDLALFVRGTDSRIYVNWRLTTNQWTGWALVPGGGFTPASPAAAVLNGNLGLFVQGTDSGLYVNWLLTTNQWTGWGLVPGGGFTPSAPAATVLNGNLGLFVQGTDSRIYVNWLLTNNQWTGWGLVPGGAFTPASPAATVLNGNLGLFVRGTDSRIYVNWLLTTNQWTGWGFAPGGGFTPASPAATGLEDELALFVQGTDNRIYVNCLTGP